MQEKTCTSTKIFLKKQCEPKKFNKRRTLVVQVLHSPLIFTRNGCTSFSLISCYNFLSCVFVHVGSFIEDMFSRNLQIGLIVKLVFITFHLEDSEIVFAAKSSECPPKFVLGKVLGKHGSNLMSKAQI